MKEIHGPGMYRFTRPIAYRTLLKYLVFSRPSSSRSTDETGTRSAAARRTAGTLAGLDVAFNQSGQSIHLPQTVVEWADMFQSDMMDAGELTYLAATLAVSPWEGDGIVVEIGAYRGSTSAFMAKVLHQLGHRVPILSIDPFERAMPDPLNPQGVYAAYLQTTRDHEVEDTCLPLVAFSKDAWRVVPDTVGVLVVDGGHEHAIVSEDLHFYASKVLPGGFVFIDDYGDAYPGVMRAVDEYFVSTRPFAIVHKSYFVVAQRR